MILVNVHLPVQFKVPAQTSAIITNGGCFS